MEKGKTIKVFGKWILAGEYIVLKSYPALAFPLYSHFIEMNFVRNKASKKTTVFTKNIKLKKQALPSRILKQCSNLDHNKATSQSVTKHFFTVLDMALKKVNKTRADLSCEICLRSRMVFGGGMGSSAVLCVLVGRLFQHIKWLKKEELFDFCHTLENYLHGQSSGLDIAVVLKGKPVLFFPATWKVAKAKVVSNCQGLPKNDLNTPTPHIKTFKPLYQPTLFLSYANLGRATKQNIQKVKAFWTAQPKKAQMVNQQMNQAVLKALESLMPKKSNQNKSLLLLKEAFSLAENCFLKWGLIGVEMKKHIAFLKKQGALAVKPTGSGSHGYVLSLWLTPPPEHLSSLLIPAFALK